MTWVGLIGVVLTVLGLPLLFGFGAQRRALVALGGKTSLWGRTRLMLGDRQATVTRWAVELPCGYPRGFLVVGRAGNPLDQQDIDDLALVEARAAAVLGATLYFTFESVRMNAGLLTVVHTPTADLLQLEKTVKRAQDLRDAFEEWAFALWPDIADTMTCDHEGMRGEVAGRFLDVTWFDEQAQLALHVDLAGLRVVKGSGDLGNAVLDLCVSAEGPQARHRLSPPSVVEPLLALVHGRGGRLSDNAIRVRCPPEDLMEVLRLALQLATALETPASPAP